MVSRIVYEKNSKLDFLKKGFLPNFFLLPILDEGFSRSFCNISPKPSPLCPHRKKCKSFKTTLRKGVTQKFIIQENGFTNKSRTCWIHLKLFSEQGVIPFHLLGDIPFHLLGVIPFHLLGEMSPFITTSFS